MTKTIKFLIGLYLLSAIGVWALFSQNTETNTSLMQELDKTNGELAAVKTILETEQAIRALTDKKISEARTNINFLTLALCPTLEATNKDALCIKNNAEWFSQTIQAGTLIATPETKAKMDALLISLGSKKQPTAKQFYEMLKQIEIDSLKALSRTLK